MQTAIATVSLSGTLNEKLEAIANAQFRGVEMFENDLRHLNVTPCAHAHARASVLPRIYRHFWAIGGHVTPSAGLPYSNGCGAVSARGFIGAYADQGSMTTRRRRR